jgi:hypothetical protein
MLMFYVKKDILEIKFQQSFNPKSKVRLTFDLVSNVLINHVL